MAQQCLFSYADLMQAVCIDDYEDDDEEEEEAGTSAQNAQTAVTDTVSKLKSTASGLAEVTLLIVFCALTFIESAHSSFGNNHHKVHASQG